MAREYVCSYPDCPKSTLIVVTTPEDRYRFCSEEHAGLFLLRKAWGGKEPKTFVTKLKNDISKSL
jgi:hypothetical protein